MTNTHRLYATYSSDDGEVRFELCEGDLITDFRGDPWHFKEVSRQGTIGKSGKILTTEGREFYLSVFPGMGIHVREGFEGSEPTC